MDLVTLVVVEVLLYVHRNRRFIRDGSPGRPPRLSHNFLALISGYADDDDEIEPHVLGCRLTY